MGGGEGSVGSMGEEPGLKVQCSGVKRKQKGPGSQAKPGETSGHSQEGLG